MDKFFEWLSSRGWIGGNSGPAWLIGVIGWLIVEWGLEFRMWFMAWRIKRQIKDWTNDSRR